MKILRILFIILFCSSLNAQQTNTYLKGKAAIEQEAWGTAIELLNTITKSNPNYNEAQYSLAYSFYKTKNYSGAINIIEASDVTYNKTKLLHAKIYAAKGKPIEAVTRLNEYLKSIGNPTLKSILYDKAFSNIYNSEAWQAYTTSYQASEINQRIDEVNYLIRKKSYPQAHELADKLVLNYPQTESHSAKGDIYEAEGLPVLALQSYKKALGLDKENAEILEKIAKNQISANQLENAKNSYTSLIKNNPERFTAYKPTIGVYIALEEYDAAKQLSATYTELFPNDKEAQLNAAKVAVKSGNVQAALRYINPLYNSDLPKLDFYLTRGEIYLNAGMFKNASSDFSMYLDLSPNSQKVNLLLGNTHHKLNNASLACYYWKRARNFGSMEAIEYLLENCE